MSVCLTPDGFAGDKWADALVRVAEVCDDNFPNHFMGLTPCDDQFTSY